MRRISFGLTKPQFVDGSKDVTRRLGWRTTKPGDRLLAVDRVMGFKPGQKAEVLGVIEVVSVRRERLDEITIADVQREGFPGHDDPWFISMFCQAMRCHPHTEVTRIEFRRVEEARTA